MEETGLGRPNSTGLSTACGAQALESELEAHTEEWPGSQEVLLWLLLLLVAAMGTLGDGFLLWLLDMSGNEPPAIGPELLTLSGQGMMLARNNLLGGPGSQSKGLPGPVAALLQPPDAHPQWQPLPGAACLAAGVACALDFQPGLGGCRASWQRWRTRRV